MDSQPKTSKRLGILKFIPRYLRPTFKFSFLLTFIIAGLALIFYPKMQPVIPIFYSLAKADAQLAHKSWLFFYPGLSLTINLLHILIIKMILNMERTIVKIFSSTTLVLQVLICLILIRTIIIIN